MGEQAGFEEVDSAGGRDAPVTSTVPSLVAAGDFCRACGADLEPSVGRCDACGAATVGAAADPPGTVGAVYELRRGLRKRLAVRLDDGEDTAHLLLTTGEAVNVPVAELPPLEQLSLRDGPAVEPRTRRGRLLRLAVASASAQIKPGWEPAGLIGRALDDLSDLGEARGVAADLLSMGGEDLLDRLPLSAAEVTWLRAYTCACKGDHAGTMRHVAQLPERGYRQKLNLIARVWADAKSSGIDLSPILRHLAAYGEDEPLAALLLRSEFPGARHDDPETVRAGQRGIVERLTAHGGRGDLRTAVEVLEERDIDPVVAESLPQGLRILAARQMAAPGLLGSAELERLDPAILDDVIDAGSVLLGDGIGSRGDETWRERYIRSRVAPESLSDADVTTLGLADEVARRAFRYGALEKLESLGDSPRIRHFRALLDLRQGRVRDDLLDDVEEQDREAVKDLIRLVEGKGSDPLDEALVTERLLADPTVWSVLVATVGAGQLGQLTGIRETHPAFSEWLSLHEARERLFLGDWRGAVDAASHCLALAQGEAVRDEAHNLKACGLFYLGNYLSAMQELTEALEGAYSESLLANASLVAEGLSPESAARHLGTLIREAPTLAMRVAAAHRAVLIWRSTDASLWRNSDESPLPDAFQDALRELVNEQISLDDFRRFAHVLALYDGQWFSDPSNTAASPHNDTLEARFYRARTAPDLFPTVAVMGEAIAAGDAPAWLLHERDSLRQVAIDTLFDDLDAPDSTFGYVALAMVDRGVLADDYDNCLFNMLGIASTTYHLTDKGTTVGDELVARLHVARTAAANLPGDGRGRIRDLTELATRRVALNRYLPLEREFNRSVELYNGALDLGRYEPPGTPAYQQALARTREALAVARQVREAASPWLLIVEHDGLRTDYKEIVTGAQDIERRCLEILS